jgi:hypothetical protein
MVPHNYALLFGEISSHKSNTKAKLFIRQAATRWRLFGFAGF